jgi:hypothetical protein
MTLLFFSIRSSLIEMVMAVGHDGADITGGRK